jgi:DNA repair photolyase
VSRRFETVRALAAAGVPSGIAVAPVIPGLNDGDIPELLRQAREAGATFAFRSLLRLPGSSRDVFLRRLAEEFPDRARRVEARLRDVRGTEPGESRFGKRMRGSGSYWSTIVRFWEVSMRKNGLSERWSSADSEDARTFVRPRRTAPGQMDLWSAPDDQPLGR